MNVENFNVGDTVVVKWSDNNQWKGIVQPPKPYSIRTKAVRVKHECGSIIDVPPSKVFKA